MAKRNYKQGQNRYQLALLPPSIDEYVSENSPVRAIDAYVDTLELSCLNFQHSQASAGPGQPAYHPGMLTKFYLYGYLNSIRKLER